MSSNKIRIPIKLSRGKDMNYNLTPLTLGVPFAQDELKLDDHVQLVNSKDEILPIQTNCLTTWSKELKYVKWLLVDTQIPGDMEEDEIYLKYSIDKTDNKISNIKNKIEISEKNGYYIVNTGVMKMWFKKSFKVWEQPHNPDVLARCQLLGDDGSWKEIFQGAPGPYLYMSDQYGNEYDSYSAGPSPRVFIEETGPLRTSICIKGYHVRNEGYRFCPYTLRVHLFAGMSDIKIQHTFIFDQEPHQIELNSIGMKFPLDLGDKLRAAIGGVKDSHYASNFKQFKFLQEDDRNYEVCLNGEDYGSGDKTSGWASLNGNRGGAVAVIKNSWQEYPKGFELNADGIDVQIWPKSYTKTLKFTTPLEEPAIRFPVGLHDEEEFKRCIEEGSPTAPLNLKVIKPRSLEHFNWIEEMVEKYAPDRIKSHNDTGTENGIGAAKTTELYLRLKPAKINDEEAEKMAKGIQDPLMGIVDPRHTCNTRVFGHMYPAGDSRFEEIDRGLNDIELILCQEPITLCRLYGMMRYGNMVCSHSHNPKFLYKKYKDTDPEKALEDVGPYNNEADDQIMSLWCNFIRSGKREHRLLAQGYSRCVADVSFIHAHPEQPEIVGLMHYHGGHQWCGGPSPSHTVVSGLMADYYLTGNHRLLEVALETADRHVRTQEPAGIISCQGGLLREFLGPLTVLLEAYQATWKEKYSTLALRSLNWILRTLPEGEGEFTNSVKTAGKLGDEALIQPPGPPETSWGNRYYLFEPAIRLFDNKTLEDYIIACADYFTWKVPLALEDVGGLHYESAVVCVAYELTYDLNYAAYASYLLEENFPEAVEDIRENYGFGNIKYPGFISRLTAIVTHAMDNYPEKFKQAKSAWKKKREEMSNRELPPRPDNIEYINLGQLSTGSHLESEI